MRLLHPLPFLQCPGRWPSESWEERQRAVWVPLSDEHGHRVLLPHPWERCVCFCHSVVCLFFSHFYSLFQSVAQMLSQPFRHQTLQVSEESACEHCVCLCACTLGARSLSSVASLESPVICCLGPLIQYLQEFNLERVLRSERYTHGPTYTNKHAHTQQHQLQTS